MGVDFIQQVGVVHVVDFKSGALFFDHKNIFDLLEVEQALDSCLVFLSVEDPLRWKVVLDDVLKGAIIPQEAQLDDVVAELFPLHGLVAVDIDFFKKVNQGKGDLMLELFIFFIVIQMIEHT